MPETLGWLYQAAGRPFQRPRVQVRIEAASVRSFARLFREHDPHLTICTHFLPSSLIHRMRHKGRTECRIATVVTSETILRLHPRLATMRVHPLCNFMKSSRRKAT